MTAAGESAAQLDLAIDDLLDEGSGPRPVADIDLLATARLLRETLPRFHPRFSFEELLAARLASARGATSTGSPPPPIPLRRGGIEPVGAVAGPEDLPDGSLDRTTHAGERRRRGWVAGGAIASGVSLAIPIAAIVVRRRTRSSGGLS